MEGDIGASQEAVRLLGTDAGLNFLKAVTDRHVLEATDSRSRVKLWQTQISPLFHLITHQSLVDSNILENEVAAMYSFLVGVNASRMKRLFGFVLDLAAVWQSLPGTDAPLMTVLELSLSVLAKAIDYSTTNIVNEDFHHVVARFAHLMQHSPQTQSEFCGPQATRYLDYLQRRLGVGKSMGESVNTQSPSKKQELFVLRRDLPGRLSSDGPRHNNDHEEISDILIMPTYDEIITPRLEYLPTTDSSQWHLPGIRGRLDREFRLLREDTIGQLRDAIRDMLERIRNPDAKEKRQSQNSARTSSYDEAIVHSVAMNKFKGLELTVRCKQPGVVGQMDDNARRHWWDQGKRLQPGALACVLDAAGMIQFCVVAESAIRTESTKNKQAAETLNDSHETKEPLTLSFSRDHLYVKLNLVGTSEADIGRVLRWYQGVGSSPPRYLVEFPGVLLASFKHTLEALQKLSQKPTLPFTNLIAPEISSSGAEARVSPPMFARGPGFEFDLSCLASNHQPFSASIGGLPPADEVSARTGLDMTQSEALLSTLSRELSLIQGPPGTGKSYTGEKIIKVLLANKAKAKLGPIVCVCYTNHALDQLLEHLLDDGIERIIRMGSRSKSERLEGLNLRVVAQGMNLTKAEKKQMYDLKQKLIEVETRTTRLLARLSDYDSLSSIRAYLDSHEEAHYTELFGGTEVDEEGFKVVQRKVSNIVDHWLRGGSQPSRGPGSNSRDVAVLKSTRLSDMTQPERQRLFRDWLKNIRDPIVAEISGLHKEYEQAKEQQERVRQEIRRRCLQQADIVGVTTTGLARELNLLRKLRSKVVVCEEAGEVLEAHLLTALLPSVEQAVLIGDHQQLRPQIQNYELQSVNPRGEQYSLDTSLFERLVQPPHLSDIRLPVNILETQRRMYPSIAEMVRSTLYKSLKDGENVKTYPEVMGMARRLFWLDHSQLEAGASVSDPHSTSHSNDFEVEMTAALVSHLVRQGHYNPEDIAVLTPYMGQLQKLRRRMAAESTFAVAIDERDLEQLEELEAETLAEQVLLTKQQISKTTLLRSMRLATVDNFQGEEAKVVIISLVRGNPQNRCGFLSTSNRINVLMSRAKHGCYIIGNSNTYQNVPMWNKIIQLLQNENNFGTRLELKCPRHSETPIFVSQPDDFARFSPDGGCSLPCDRRLNCGHACYGRCHSDLLHTAVKCHEKCPRPKAGCDHACPLECGDECEERCSVLLKDIDLKLPCGHIVKTARCWEAQSPAAIVCKQSVDRKVLGCEHVVTLPCHIDIASPSFRCKAACGKNLACGHTCRSPCHNCNVRKEGQVVETNHGICQQTCGRSYTTCPHTCRQACHDRAECGPCEQPCEVRCSHSRCSKPCHEPCAPCAEENCASHCPHTKCTMPCAAPCNWIPCSKRCTLTLACGHQCPSLCGEACPDAKYCQQCGSEDTLSMVADYLMMDEYKDIDLDEDPCVFPDCGHILTRTSMDGSMAMGDHYDVDESGSPVAIKAPSMPFAMDNVEFKSCPQCRGSLRNIARYGRIVRRVMLDETTKKFISWSGNTHLQLAERLVQEEQCLDKDKTNCSEEIGRPGQLALTGHVPAQLSQLRKWVGKGRYKNAIKLYMEILRYRDRVRVEEQPFQRVANFVKHANGNKNVEARSFAFDDSVIQLRGYLLATSLLLKANICILSDFTSLWKTAASVRTEVKIDFTANVSQCQELMKLAAETDRPELEAEGHIHYAQFCGFALALGHTPQNPQSTEDIPGAYPEPIETTETDARETLKIKGLEHVGKARALLANRSWVSKDVMTMELEAAENMLNGGVFYRPVTGDELRAVYAAMSREFSGTGHWYTCERGHPFTIGECGMPMQLARCPECGSPVGGQSHTPARGVRQASEIEELGREVGGMRI